MKATINPGMNPKKTCFQEKAPATNKFHILNPKTIISHIKHVNTIASLKLQGVLFSIHFIFYQPST